MGQSLSSFPLDYRAMIYRQFAADALRQAESETENDRRASHLVMAARWHSLALETELDRWAGGELGAETETAFASHWFGS